MAAPWRELTARTSPQHSSELDLTESGPAHDSDSRGAVGAVRHLAWDKTECPPLPPTGADGTPAHMARAHRTVLPAALIQPRASLSPRTCQWQSGGRGGGAAPRMGQNGVPAPPPDRGRW